MSTTTLPERLRALRATARPHFQPHNPDGTARPAAFAIVATEERLDDLVTAARLLEHPTPPTLQCPDLTAEEVAGIAEQLRGGQAMVVAEPAGELVSWRAFDDGDAMQGLRDCIQQRARLASDVVASLEDNAIRAKLVELGWTPPGEAPKLSKSLQAMLDDPDSELVTHGQVREAAQAELATWDQAAPGGPTAYEVAHSICRRLGVAL